MRRSAAMTPDDPVLSESRRRWRIGTLSSLVGSLLGVATSLYSAEFRALLETPLRGLSDFAVPFLLTAAVASISTVLVYEAAIRRRQPVSINPGKIVIEPEVVSQLIDRSEPLVGRSLRYLEAKRHTDRLVVLLHGLGLDANDFRPYLVESSLHCVALTQYGFNAIERAHPHYQPISLRSHALLLGYALRRIHRAYPRKQLCLVGFSFGADMLLYLAEHHQSVLAELPVRRTVLLDPNINNTTTVISSRVAGVSSDSSTRELVSILRTAKTPLEFRYLCAYLTKITSKNFAHVRRFAREMSDRYRDPSLAPFIARLAKLHQVTDRFEVVLSLNHENVFNELVPAVNKEGLDVSRLHCSRTDHFELITPAFLTRLLDRR
jgi:pimeloyl-ACP methyl ester carboxylesterase